MHKIYFITTKLILPFAQFNKKLLNSLSKNLKQEKTKDKKVLVNEYLLNSSMSVTLCKELFTIKQNSFINQAKYFKVSILLQLT